MMPNKLYQIWNLKLSQYIVRRIIYVGIDESQYTGLQTFDDVNHSHIHIVANRVNFL